MHEYTLIQNLIEEVHIKMKERKASKLKLIELHVGESSGYSKENLKQAFDILITETEFKDAELKLTSIDGSDIYLQSFVLEE